MWRLLVLCKSMKVRIRATPVPLSGGSCGMAVHDHVVGKIIAPIGDKIGLDAAIRIRSARADESPLGSTVSDQRSLKLLLGRASKRCFSPAFGPGAEFRRIYALEADELAVEEKGVAVENLDVMSRSERSICRTGFAAGGE